MKKLLMAFAAIALMACSSHKEVVSETETVPTIIFETDIGNDIDDALALDMIYKYLDEGKINLLAICSNKESKYSTEYIHLMNHWYGYPNIPIGKVVNGIDCENDARKYAEYTSLLKDSLGNELFPRPQYKHDEIPEAVSLYRKILSTQKDSSVTIVSVGFSTNIVRLLQSAPDEYSKLTGKELVAQKVKLLSIMAGSFGENKIPEYNVMKDIPSAQVIAEEWPTPVVFTPYEAGIAVEYPAESIENDFAWAKHHPLVEAYKHYLDMPYCRPTWDLISLLYVVENSPEYFTQSQWGTIKVDDKGYTNFAPDEKGNRAYLELSPQQAEKTKKRFVEVVTKAPKSQVK